MARRPRRPLLLLLPLVACAAAGGVAPGSSDAFTLPLRCQGNEPFWNLSLGVSEARWEALAEPGRVRVFRGGPDLLLGGGVAWVGAGPEGTALSATLHAETCLDTMSDETPPFAYRAEVRIGENRLSGCCRRGG